MSLILDALKKAKQMAQGKHAPPEAQTLIKSFGFEKQANSVMFRRILLTYIVPAVVLAVIIAGGAKFWMSRQAGSGSMAISRQQVQQAAVVNPEPVAPDPTPESVAPAATPAAPAPPPATAKPTPKPVTPSTTAAPAAPAASSRATGTAPATAAVAPPPPRPSNSTAQPAAPVTRRNTPAVASNTPPSAAPPVSAQPQPVANTVPLSATPPAPIAATPPVVAALTPNVTPSCPTNDDAYTWGGRYYNSGEWTKALVCYEIAAAKNPNESVYNNIGATQFNLNRITDAIGSFRLAQTFNQNYDKTYNNLGNAYLANRQVALARQAYLDAIKRNDGNISARVNLGRLELGEKNVDQAMKYLLEAIRMDKMDPLAHYYLGQAYEDKGEFGKAISEYKTFKDNPGTYAGNIPKVDAQISDLQKKLPPK